MPDFKPKIEMADVAKLIPYDRNPRTHTSGQVEKIAKSIREFGFINPIIVANTGEIIAGHGRLRAAQKLGLKKVPILRADHLTREQWQTYVVADNRLTELGGWDEDLLTEQLRELKELNIDLSLTGLSEIEVIQILDLQEPEVLAKPDPEKPKASSRKEKKDALLQSSGEGSEPPETASDPAASDAEPVAKKGLNVIAYCESYSQQLDAMNALRALGIKCAAK